MNSPLLALVYSVGGFAAGYGSAWASRRAAEADVASTGRRLEWWRIPLGLLILFLVGYTTVSTYRFNTCQRDANTAFTAALSQRSAAQLQWIEAQEAFLDVTANPAATAGDKMAAYHRYRDALTRLKAVQAANPLTVTDCS